jgi:TRAP-type C4-dicarboxylate transport system permease small subunit
MAERLARMLGAWSERIARVEAWAAGLLAAAVAGLILLNVATRTAGMALFWVDELAVYAMVWMAFLGASVAVARRSSVSVTILTDALPAPVKRMAGLLIDLVVLAFALFLAWLCWRWYDLPTLAGFGFDVEAFTGETFNFMYKEPTQTIGVAKFWVWLIVPITAVGMSLHAAANLFEKRPA